MNNFLQVPKLGRIYVHVYPVANVVKFDYAVLFPEKGPGEYGSVDELKFKKYSTLKKEQVHSELVEFLDEYGIPSGYADQAIELCSNLTK